MTALLEYISIALFIHIVLIGSRSQNSIGPRGKICGDQ